MVKANVGLMPTLALTATPPRFTVKGPRLLRIHICLAEPAHLSNRFSIAFQFSVSPSSLYLFRSVLKETIRPVPERPSGLSSVLLIRSILAGMADASQISKLSAGSRRQPSRLQRRAPSSLLINRSCEWNVAIPLLSPTMEEAPPTETAREGAPPQEQQPQQQRRLPSAEPENVVFNKWQHPAAPFCYDPPSSTVVTPFVPVEL
ncbi:uncharacterized protein LOC129319611 [Prosopis cineraria]|uniref:uncharacterized protein LOC129319611 n=1 Tax=Prosopis cineraria TaxID=364024 RepID=UPI0024102CD1|nr:uncharacterized protein LOC129319611 [Prosopis cineraria]